MEIVDCKWEIQNIHKKTIEITVERGDIFGDMNDPCHLSMTRSLSPTPIKIRN